MPHYLRTHSDGRQSDLTPDEHLRVGDVVPGAPPEVVLSAENGQLHTRPTERPLVEVELTPTRVDDQHTKIGLIEPEDDQEFSVGDQVTFHTERWRVEHVTTPLDGDNVLRLVCSRVP